MAQNAGEITVAASGHISVAKYGVTLPTDPTASLDAGFIELGYVSTNGVTLTNTPAVTDINSWQSATPTRRLVTARTLTAAFSLQQLNLESFALAMGADPASAWSSVGSQKWRFDPPADTDALVDYSLVVDAQDGSKHYRYVIIRGNVTDAVSTAMTRTAAQELPVTFSALSPSGAVRAWYMLTDDVNMSYAS